MNRLDEYLKEIRALSGLQNALLRSLTVSKRNKIVEFLIITDKAYTAQEEAEACGISGKYLPSGFVAKTRIVKRVPDEADRRAMLVVLTEKGREFDRRHLSNISTNDHLAMQGLTGEEQETLLRLLTRIRDNLSER